jgi:hypothetical protein
MFDYQNVAVIYLRMFLTILAGNLAEVNKRLNDLALVHRPGSVIEPSMVLFAANGVSATIVLLDGAYHLVLMASKDGTSKSFKLGKTATISKAVLNQLEVWFHKEYRAIYTDSITVITESIKKVNIKPFITEIGWLKRLTFGQNVKEIKYGAFHLDQLLSTRVTVQRGITNKLQVFVDIHTGGIKGELTNYIPVHAGIMRSYYANASNDPVNKWLREALLEHVDVNLK